MNSLYEDLNYIACPHTAIAWLALQDYRKAHKNENFEGVFLSTAHACKFPDVFPEAIKAKIEIPEQVQRLTAKEKQATEMDASFESFKSYLMNI